MFLSSKEWQSLLKKCLESTTEFFHVTWADVAEKFAHGEKVNASINLGKEEDFGAGFYLFPIIDGEKYEQLAYFFGMSMIEAYAEINGEGSPEAIEKLKKEYTLCLFSIGAPLANYGAVVFGVDNVDEWREYIFQNRTEPSDKLPEQDVTVGPMSRAEGFFSDYRRGKLTAEACKQAFGEVSLNSDYDTLQVALHNQAVCDTLAYRGCSTFYEIEKAHPNWYAEYQKFKADGERFRNADERGEK